MLFSLIAPSSEIQHACCALAWPFWLLQLALVLLTGIWESDVGGGVPHLPELLELLRLQVVQARDARGVCSELRPMLAGKDLLQLATSSFTGSSKIVFSARLATMLVVSGASLALPSPSFRLSLRRLQAQRFPACARSLSFLQLGWLLMLPSAFVSRHILRILEFLMQPAALMLQAVNLVLDFQAFCLQAISLLCLLVDLLAQTLLL
mmetsp:Transcript_119851/g.284779  ORF Transcript_119851/g.284779 Transcript_119851/m.284779 type:complete len:207 (+) Transcript_119851:1201-1821(+)